MLRKIAFLIVVTVIFLSLNTEAINNIGKGIVIEFDDIGDEFAWAKESIAELSARGVVSGVGKNIFSPSSPVTKEQVAAMISKAFSLTDNSGVQTYTDVTPDRWSFNYVEGTKNILMKSSDASINLFEPERAVTRSELIASCVKAMGYGEGDGMDKDILSKVFYDYTDVSPTLLPFVSIAAERGLIKGSDGYLRPNAFITRAEATVILYRAISAKEGKGDAVTITQTPIIDAAHITQEAAQMWAQERGADKRFIDVAPLYWKYANLTGINPEIMYAQAAKETNFGKYTGNVRPEQNNWAGIKIYSPEGDRPEDHESFSDPDDGVRAHFNHMCAYVGLAPVGQTHARYEIVKNLAWAGTVKYAEELGTKWAPDYTYGYSLVAKYVADMRK